MKTFYTLLSAALMMLSVQTFAAVQPTDIKFSSRKTTMFGTKYSVYAVRCSDGSRRTISSWNKRKQWCQGDSKSRCTNDQLKAARIACNN